MFCCACRLLKKKVEKLDEHLDLAREMKRLWNINVTVIPIVVEAHGTVPKNLKKDWMNWRFVKRLKPSRPQHYKNWLRYLEGPWRSEATCCHSNSSEKPLTRAVMKNSREQQQLQQ